MKILRILAVLATLVAGASAQDITGTILIKKKLTKRSVTAPVSVYQRGAVVSLGKDAEEDPLAFERSRVVLYLEAASPSAPRATRPTRQPRRANRAAVHRPMPDDPPVMTTTLGTVSAAAFAIRNLSTGTSSLATV